MINHEDIKAAEYIVRDSGAAAILSNGLIRDSRGRRPNPRAMELLLIGMFLSIHHKGLATVSSAYKTLTKDLPLDEQMRLGIYEQKTDGSGHVFILKTKLDHQVARIRDLLAYGEMSTPDLDDDERLRRLGVVGAFSATVMDLFDLGFEADTFALDATGLPSWAKKGKRRKPLTEEQLSDWEPPIQEELVRQASGDTTSDESESTPVATEDVKKKRRRRRLRGPDLGASDDKGDDGLGYTNSADPDADFGVKTAQTGGKEVFFGYQEHTLVIAPECKKADDPKVPPVIVRRLELTPASEDVVAVSLRLFDSMKQGAIKNLLVDRHYHYKTPARWLDELRKRKIKQHHDLRSDEHGGITYEGIRFIDGAGHCPKVPKSFETILRPGPGASEEARKEFAKQIDRRFAYSVFVNEQPDENGSFQCQCPALVGKVGCPLRAGTISSASRGGMPIIEKPPNPEVDGIPLPRICEQKFVTLRPPDKIRKHQQSKYWGSKEWEKMFRRRTAVEGSYGGRKNVSTENLNRGVFQCMGLPFANIGATLVAASYNLRMVRNWHERSGLGDPNHVFLAKSDDLEWEYLTKEESTNRKRLYAEILGQASADEMTEEA